MGELMFACPSVPILGDSEVRFSVQTSQVYPIFRWPLAYVSCGEIIPPQLRLQWGAPTNSARYDSFGGIRFGQPGDKVSLTLGARTTYTSSDSEIAPVEQQRVGVASLTLGGRVNFKYWNDHSFWWWPMGDGGDQGDTAGLQFSYNLDRHNLGVRGWAFQGVSLTMRLATGIPDPKSAKPMGDGSVYSDIRFQHIDRGDLNLNTTLMNRQRQHLDVGITVNSGAVRHAVQSRLVHHSLQIPEFPRTDNMGVMFYMRLTDW
jgi:hypothetical protein